jgi:ribosomal protein L29
MNIIPAYREDHHAWALANAALLRSGRLSEIDVEHIAEELEDMGASKERELESRLGVLLAHLLKWVFQPERRGNSWIATIREQRRRIARLLQKNPSLKTLLEETFEDAYGDARLIAMRETGLDESTFPEASPFTVEEALAEDFWPN